MVVADDPRVRSARNGTLLVFAANGLVLATWLSRLPDVKALMGLTPGELGILILGISVGSLTGLPLAGRLLDRMGSVRVVRLGAGLAFPAMLVAAIAVTVGWPLAAAMAVLAVVGFGIGIWDVAQNLQGSQVEQSLGRSIMPWFHAAFSGGTVVGALIAVLLIRAGVSTLAHVTTMVLVCAGVTMWGTRRFLPSDTPSRTHTAARPTSAGCARPGPSPAPS